MVTFKNLLLLLDIALAKCQRVTIQKKYYLVILRHRVRGIFLSQSLLTSQSLRAAIGPLQFSLRHWNIRNLTLHSGMLPYKHASRSLEIFSAKTVLSHGSIMLPPHQPRVFARLTRWQLLFLDTLLTINYTEEN